MKKGREYEKTKKEMNCKQRKRVRKIKRQKFGKKK